MLLTNEIKCVCCQLVLYFAVSMCFAAAIAVAAAIAASSFLCPILLNSPLKCQRSCLEGLLPLCAPHPATPVRSPQGVLRSAKGLSSFQDPGQRL